MHFRPCLIGAFITILCAGCASPNASAPKSDPVFEQAKMKMKLYPDDVPETMLALEINNTSTSKYQSPRKVYYSSVNYRGIGGWFVRARSSSNPSDARFVNFQEISEIRIDSSKQTPSYLVYRDRGEKWFITSEVEYSDCDEKRKCDERVILQGIGKRRVLDLKPFTGVGEYYLALFELNDHLGQHQRSSNLVTEVKIFHGDEAYRQYMLHRGHECQAARAMANEEGERRASERSRLEAISRTRPLTGGEQTAFIYASRSNYGRDVPKHCSIR